MKCLRKEITPSGFQYLATTTDVLVVAQESSAIGTYEDAVDRPGSSKLWIGEGSHRPHLDREAVAELRDSLTRWLSTGRLYRVAKLTPETGGEES